MVYSVNSSQSKLKLESLSISSEKNIESNYLSDSHKKIKELVFLLKNYKWEEAFNHYQNQLTTETKKEIESLIFKRSLLIKPLSKESEVGDLIDLIFTFIIDNDINNKELSLKMMRLLFIPSVYNYLIEKFEQAEARSIIESAEQIIKCVREKIPFSPNYANRDDQLMKYILSNNTSEPNEAYAKKVKYLNDEFDNLVKYRGEFFVKNPALKKNIFLQSHSFAQVCQDLHIGRCEQMAASGLLQSHLGMEIWALKIGDHVVNVDYRDKDSDPSDYLTWGDRCYVIDAWTKEKNIFSAHDIPLYLKDFIEMGSDGNPIIENFDYNSDELELLYTNMFSLKDFSGFVDESEIKDQVSIKWFELKLKSFHETSSLDLKNQLQKKLLLAITKYILK